MAKERSPSTRPLNSGRVVLSRKVSIKTWVEEKKAPVNRRITSDRCNEVEAEKITMLKCHRTTARTREPLNKLA